MGVVRVVLNVVVYIEQPCPTYERVSRGSNFDARAPTLKIMAASATLQTPRHASMSLFRRGKTRAGD